MISTTKLLLNQLFSYTETVASDYRTCSCEWPRHGAHEMWRVEPATLTADSVKAHPAACISNIRTANDAGLKK